MINPCRFVRFCDIYSTDGGTVLPDEWNKAVDQSIADAAKIIDYYGKKCRQEGVRIYFDFYYEHGDNVHFLGNIFIPVMDPE